MRRIGYSEIERAEKQAILESAKSQLPCILCGTQTFSRGTFHPKEDPTNITVYALCKNHPMTIETFERVEEATRPKDGGPH